jgi:hypothetical protein
MGSVSYSEPGQMYQKLFNASYATMRDYYDLYWSGYEAYCYSVSFHDLNKVQSLTLYLVTHAGSWGHSYTCPSQ